MTTETMFTAWHTSSANAKARTKPSRPESQAMSNFALYSENNDIFLLDPRLPKACALFRHRRGRKTETSSDASDEAPERARKDATKEVKLHCEGSHPSLRLSVGVSQASIRRFPCPQGRRSRGDRPTSADASARRPYQLVATCATIPAREICLPRRSGACPTSQRQKHYSKKSDLRT